MMGQSLVQVGAVVVVVLASLGLSRITTAGEGSPPQPRPWVEIRGVYGGVPTEIFDRGESLSDYGINAVWIGSGGLNAESIARLKRQGARVFAEFNTMHDASYLKDHPDAAPVGTDGEPCPPPEGWQGICPTHPGYRKARMAAFRETCASSRSTGSGLTTTTPTQAGNGPIPNCPTPAFAPAALPFSSSLRVLNCPIARPRRFPGCSLGRTRRRG